jgi:hypothetical protein
MKVVKIIAISVIGLAALLCAGASANQPSTRPADSSPYTNPQIRRALRAMTGKTKDVKAYTQQEWDEMMEFMKTNSPERERLLETFQLSHDSPIRLDAIRKWRNYNFTKDHFPAIADDLIRRFKLEDDLFYLTLKIGTSMGSERIEYRDMIHDKIRDIVNLELGERQARIDTLEKLLSEEKSKLVMDKASKEDLIDRRTGMIISRVERQYLGLPPPATTRPDGSNAADDMAPSPTPDPVINVSH